MHLDDDDLAAVTVRVQPPLAHVPPGLYTARSADLTVFHAFTRKNLRVDFDLFAAPDALATRLAQVPMYLRVPGPRGITPRSKFGQWLTLAGVSMPHGRIPIEALRFKLWRVEVVDAQRDYALRPLRTPYSVVSRVLERLS